MVTTHSYLVAKTHNINLDAFHNEIGKEVFIVRGNQKGYRATLDSFTTKHCIVSLPGQKWTKLKLQDIITRYRMRLNGVILEALPPQSITPPVEAVPPAVECLPPSVEAVAPSIEGLPPTVEGLPLGIEGVPPSVKGLPPAVEGPPLAVKGLPPSITDPTSSLSSAWTTWSASAKNTDVSHNLTLGINPSPLTNNPWVVDEQDIWESHDARVGKPQDNSPIHWLMNKEFALKLFTYHVVLKVSTKFKGGWLAK
ncbi:hypothetical protein BDR07DRAFT_1384918 [Suillus spraguei]|nr:hypothetical protein BDR07DRAFT_1384918 [Suillus spraguei]